MEPDFMERGYLLPKGCKDLIDALKLKPQQPPAPRPVLPLEAFNLKPELLKFKPTQPSPPHSAPPAPLPPIIGEIVVPLQTTVSKLADLLGKKPLQIIADVLQLGFFVSATETLTFEIISGVARKYGFIAIRTA
jgi:hypothetical protein